MIISESLFSGLIFVCALRCSSENYGTGELRNLPAHGCALESSSSHILMRSFAMGNMGDTIMSFAKTPSGPAEIERSQAMEAFRPLPRGITAFRRAKPIDGEATPESLNSLLGKVSETSMHGIDSLINELHTLRGKLQNDSDRIQRDIAKYAALSEQVMQMTKIIAESVHKLPDTPGVSE